MPRRPNVCFLLSQRLGKRTRSAARATLNSPSEKRRPGSRNGPTFRRCFREECAYRHTLQTNCWHLFSPRAVERFLAFLQAERKTASPTDADGLVNWKCYPKTPASAPPPPSSPPHLIHPPRESGAGDGESPRVEKEGGSREGDAKSLESFHQVSLATLECNALSPFKRAVRRVGMKGGERGRGGEGNKIEFAYATQRSLSSASTLCICCAGISEVGILSKRENRSRSRICIQPEARYFTQEKSIRQSCHHSPSMSCLASSGGSISL